MNTQLSTDQIIEVRPSKLYSVLSSLRFAFFSILFLAASYYFRNSSIPYLNIVLNSIALLVVGMGLYHYFYLRCTVFIISHDQIKTMTGVFSRQIDFLEMYRIKDYIVKQSFIFRILNLMTFTLLANDKNAANKTIIMKGIIVTILPDKIRDLVQQARLKNRVFEVDNGII